MTDTLTMDERCDLILDNMYEGIPPMTSYKNMDFSVPFNEILANLRQRDEFKHAMVLVRANRILDNVINLAEESWYLDMVIAKLIEKMNDASNKRIKLSNLGK